MPADTEPVATRLAALRAELAERRRSLPAHSIRPNQLLRIEALEEEIAALEAQQAGTGDEGGRD